MFGMFSKPSGNIAIALLLVVIGAMSGFTLTSLAMRDVVAFHYDFESIQSMLFLRSEAQRGQKVAQKLGTILVPVRTSERRIPVTNTALKKTFIIQSVISAAGVGQTTEAENYTLGDQKQTTLVRSLVKSKAGIGQAAFMNPRFSMIRKYAIFTLESETFAKFMYFTDNDSSPNGTNVYFYGPDLVYGRVHSNSPIWIKKAGGGNNDGWPTFFGWVSTTHRIESHSGTFQEDQVFQGGLSEGYPYTVFPEEAARIRRSGNTVGPIYSDPDNIVMVEVNGSSYNAYLGVVQEPKRAFSDVYNPYPPANPNTLQYRNNYTIRDTVWTVYSSGSATNTSKWVNGKLWLQGTFGTYQTWGCADTMFILGDVLLTHTPRGSSPLTNRTDVVGLVSEKSIVIKYGFRGPLDSLRYHNTSGPDTNFGGVYIYAAMAALGKGVDNSHQDGVFTFEYQHPHPSVPDVTALVGGIPTLFTKIDLHRRHYPQTIAYPWPVNPPIDFPWYNPLWPERLPYLERGYISIYGSISQRRRGFVHRSYLDSEYPNNNVWNQPIDFCGGSSSPNVTNHNDAVFGFQLTTRDYPGASGTGTGYKKNYHYDDRFYRTSPIDFPEVNREDETPFSAVNWVIKRPPENL